MLPRLISNNAFSETLGDNFPDLATVTFVHLIMIGLYLPKSTTVMADTIRITVTD